MQSTNVGTTMSSTVYFQLFMAETCREKLAVLPDASGAKHP
jgi:hypothetical protein